MASSQLGDQKLNIFWGMPILSSDSISSVAYAVEEILWVLVPTIGFASFFWMPRVALTIILLLLILVFSYRQIVDAYPNGGGAYIVAKENLGPIFGLIAGASLSVDYTLTVAVSISAGTAAITSALPGLYHYRVGLAVLLVFLIAIGNVRGIKESSRLFSFPTYAFILSVIALIIVGLAKHWAGLNNSVPQPADSTASFGTQAISIFILLRAFASGCSALTGVEAVVDAVPHFKEPRKRNAKIVYVMLATAIIICFGGIAYLAQVYHALPNSRVTVIAQLTLEIFGRGTMFYFISATTAVILAMAANTAFAGFPTLLSVIAQDGYAPRQMAMRGHRLNYNNGITMLTLMAMALIVIFNANTHMLIALYAVGVFTSFTLSQTGMVFHWKKEHCPGWIWKAIINGIGALATLTTVIIVGYNKFGEGAWIVFVVIPLLIMGMSRIKKHYQSVAKQLDIPNDFLPQLEFTTSYSHHVIVPIDSLNAMVVKALRYARSITPNVEAFHVEVYDGAADKLRRKWALLNTDIPLVIKFSPYREVVNLLTEYIDSEEHASQPGDVITVLLPQFFVSHRWEMALHNNTSLFIANAMLKKRNVVVSILPFYLDDLKAYRVSKGIDK
ncbi:MAG TPA: APC family permease [Syntrophomonadaceae bacterium]|nr:APC family permease [Syntrophomonadaceae bacterium]